MEKMMYVSFSDLPLHAAGLGMVVDLDGKSVKIGRFQILTRNLADMEFGSYSQYKFKIPNSVSLRFNQIQACLLKWIYFIL